MAEKRSLPENCEVRYKKNSRKSSFVIPGDNPFPHVTLKHRRTTLERVEKFLSPIYFRDVNLFGRLYSNHEALKSIHHLGPSDIKYEQLSKSKGFFKDFKLGQTFGTTFSRHWFKLDIEIPEAWIGEMVKLLWDADCEGMIWRDGEPVFSLTAAEDNGLKKGYTIYERMEKQHEHRLSLYISVSCNRLLGEGQDGMINPPNMEKTFTLNRAEIVAVNKDAYETFLDLHVLYDMTKSMPENSQRGKEALYAANNAINTLVIGKFSEQSYIDARNIAKMFFNSKCRHVVHAMGHCHIDSAWLWRYEETVHKCARSWLSTVSLMDKFEDFTFVCSQAQQFQWVKDHYPQIFSKIKHYVTQGRFIPVGGTWVEMDGNLPSGESMLRQFVYGQKFFYKEFGIRCKEFWLPDTFGYSANLPQIMQEAGIENFLTQKLSWSLVNTFPHNTFHWQGIDGSKVLCHFPPGDSYGMMATPQELLKTVKNHKDKGRSDESVFLFGLGDGGGGPTEAMLHRLSRISDCDGLPKVQMSTPQKFFDAVKKNSDKLCTWAGELFLELHNGTYTTLAKIKKFNRKCEFLLHDVEFLHVLLGMNNVKVLAPVTELDRLWKLLLLNQFHDVLPGSSIELAHKDAIQHYEDIVASAEKLISEGLNKLVSAAPGEVTAFNSLSWDRSEVVELPDKTLAYINCPGLSIAPMLKFKAGGVHIEKLENGSIALLNDHLKCVFDCSGRLVSLRTANTSSRELVKHSSYGNQLVVFDDVPLFWDAWDVMDYHLETRSPVLEVIEPLKVSESSSPLRVTLEYSVQLGENSNLRQTIELDVGSPIIKFKTFVDWHESHKFLKVEFPWSLNATKATYEIQFGHLERPTHQNTSWDSARYEVWAHKWGDLSDSNCGVALINDCKYGYSAFGSTMRLSLLRSPKAPDGNADMGVHEFTYAIMPHLGNLQDAGVIKQAYQINNPMRIVPGSLGDKMQFATIDTDSIIMDTCKKSDEHNGAVLIRLYEAFGGSAEAKIFFEGRKIEKVYRCNALEDIKEEVETEHSDSFVACFSPFQIKSFLVFVKGGT